jgi:site-specific DNA recombinase
VKYDLYCRLSVAADGQTETVERQERDMRAALARTGDEVGEIYVDNNLSAWDRKVVRKDFERLLARIVAGDTRHVMVWHMDRYIRQPYDLERLVRFAEQGAIIRSLYGELDLTNSDHLLSARILCAAAAKSSDDTSRRVRAKLADRVSKGLPVGQGRAFGRLPDGTVVEEEANLIREAARRYIAGQTWGAIAQDFTEKGVRTLAGKPFTRTSLREMMSRASHAGVLIHQGKPAGKLAEAILDPTTAADLESLMSGARRGAPPSTRYELTGLVYCGSCGGQKRGAIRKERKAAMAGGRPRRVYRCVPEGANRCAQGITAEYVEEIVAEHVKAALANPNYRNRIKGARDANQDEVARLEGLRTRLGAGLANLNSDYSMELIPERDYQKQRMRMLTRFAEIDGELADLTDPELAAAALVTEIDDRWEEASDEVRHQLIHGVIRRVTVDAASTRVGSRGFDPERVHVDLVLPGEVEVRLEAK